MGTQPKEVVVPLGALAHSAGVEASDDPSPPEEVDEASSLAEAAALFIIVMF